MKVHVPDEIFNIQKWDCTVRSNKNVATFIKELILELPKGENLDFTAGGYIQIDIPEYHNLSLKILMLKKNIMRIGTNLRFGMLLQIMMKIVLEHIQWQITLLKAI